MRILKRCKITAASEVRHPNPFGLRRLGAAHPDPHVVTLAYCFVGCVSGVKNNLLL